MDTPDGRDAANEVCNWTLGQTPTKNVSTSKDRRGQLEVYNAIKRAGRAGMISDEVRDAMPHVKSYSSVTARYKSQGERTDCGDRWQEKGQKWQESVGHGGLL